MGMSLPRYTIVIDNLELEFYGGQLAPPSGAFAQNYSREIHTESAPHRYVYSWTNRRSLNDRHGGNFYLAQYGVRIAGSENACLVHEAQQAHGTGLPDRQTDDTGTSLFNNGMSIFTSGRLEKAWKKWRQQQEAVEQIESDISWNDSCDRPDPTVKDQTPPTNYEGWPWLHILFHSGLLAW